MFIELINSDYSYDKKKCSNSIFDKRANLVRVISFGDVFVQLGHELYELMCLAMECARVTGKCFRDLASVSWRHYSIKRLVNTPIKQIIREMKPVYRQELIRLMTLYKCHFFTLLFICSKRSGMITTDIIGILLPNIGREARVFYKYSGRIVQDILPLLNNLLDSNKAYKELEISEDATQTEIVKAYRNLARLYHPDKQTGNQEKFQSIQAAYNTLNELKGPHTLIGIIDFIEKKYFIDTAHIDEAAEEWSPKIYSGPMCIAYPTTTV